MVSFKLKVIALGLIIGTVCILAVFAAPTHFHVLDPRTPTPGHEGLVCASCHGSAPGSVRQQIQANLAYLLGWRRAGTPFAYRSPSDTDCTACHERLDDPHAIQRFAEPRFVDALKVVAADTCGGCHREHQGVRVTSGLVFCKACHAELLVRNDPLDTSHMELIAQERWSSCLGCHDYHGNHDRRAQRVFAEAFEEDALKAYLAEGPDPYSPSKRYEPRKRRDP